MKALGAAATGATGGAGPDGFAKKLGMLAGGCCVAVVAAAWFSVGLVNENMFGAEAGGALGGATTAGLVSVGLANENEFDTGGGGANAGAAGFGGSVVCGATAGVGNGATGGLATSALAGTAGMVKEGRLEVDAFAASGVWFTGAAGLARVNRPDEVVGTEDVAAIVG